MKSLDIHLTNVNGLGAEKFVSGLVYHLLEGSSVAVKNVYASSKLQIPRHLKSSGVTFKVYRMSIFSRILEIVLWRYRHSQENDLLVLGDLPLNTSAKQYVLCHQSLIFKKFKFTSINFVKFFMFKLIFRIFLKKSDVVLVQSKEMADKFREEFGPQINVEIFDVTAEYFGWPPFHRSERHPVLRDSESITLIYPSACYPHKNHKLLKLVNLEEKANVKLTITESEFGDASSELAFLGQISREEVFQLYKTVDALLFLSSNESLGMPIVEAVKCNLPIICPYAEYTNDLSDENCFFFDLNDPLSLQEAIQLARSKIIAGWWPQLSLIDPFQDRDRKRIEEIIR